MAYTLNRKMLILDLHAAFQCAKKHKSNRRYVLTFERNLDKNIETLADELLNHTYKPSPSSCFIINTPKKREVFAAMFRDRIVHHLYFNYVHEMLERTFIQDSYSCIKQRGTHYGIERLKKHILQESRNYTRTCYVMKFDKRGYFMHINREKLLKIATESIKKMATHNASKHSRQLWEDLVDVPFVIWLTKVIVMINPKKHCVIACDKKEWIGLDKKKSLFNAPEGCGLPIGNLTSQLLSNVYLNVYDQYMKRVLKCKHYGRYVDDSFVVSTDKEWLYSIMPKVREFLKDTLDLDLNMTKLVCVEVSKGVEFLGAFVRPYRTYISKDSIYRMIKNVDNLDLTDKEKTFASINSFLGVLGHYKSFNIRCNLFLTETFMRNFVFNKDIKKIVSVVGEGN